MINNTILYHWPLNVLKIPQNTTNIDLGEKYGLNFTWIILPIALFEWFCFRRPFITGGRQYKQAVAT